MSSKQNSNDIVVLNVPFKGDRQGTASRLQEFFTKKIKSFNAETLFGTIALVDIPQATNQGESKCMAFVRFKETRCHQEFAARFNGLLYFEKHKLTINMSRNPPNIFSYPYLNNQIGWVNTEYLANYNTLYTTKREQANPFNQLQIRIQFSIKIQIKLFSPSQHRQHQATPQ